MAIIQTSAGFEPALSFPVSVSFLGRYLFLTRLRQESKLLGGFKSGRVWKLATGLSTQPLDGSQLESGPIRSQYFWMAWNHQLLLESPKKTSGNPQCSSKITSKNHQRKVIPSKITSKNHQKSPSPCESKSPMGEVPTEKLHQAVRMAGVESPGVVVHCFQLALSDEDRDSVISQMGIGWIGWFHMGISCLKIYL